MFPLDDPNKIDLVTYSQKTNELVIVMTETRPWGSDGTLVLSLQAKLKNYVAFVESGELARRYPGHEAAGVCVRLSTKHPLGDIELSFLEKAQEMWLGPLGMRLEVSRPDTP